MVAALFVLSLITYIDRAAISTAKQPMARDLSLTDAQMGAVFSAFALGYAAAQMPSGWFADRIGPRRALAIVVVLWSLLTSLTGTMTRFGPLLAVRFLFGVAEAGAYPGSARVFYNWLPAQPARDRQRHPVLRRAPRRRLRVSHLRMAARAATTGAWRSTFLGCLVSSGPCAG